MASVKEIRTKIQSIKSTQKTTRAMEMVAASKMRKAQDAMKTGKPYTKKIRDVIRHVAGSASEYHHSYFELREAKKVGYIIVSTDRGLCGGLNINMFRAVLRHMQQWKENEIPVDFCLIGRKAEAFFKRVGGNITASASRIGDRPSLADLIGVVRVMLDAYDEKKIDRLYVVYNDFVNTMTQRPIIEQLLPLEKSEEEEIQHFWDYIYEPEAKELLDQLLTRYIESQVFQAVVENIACEQAARMAAMKSASDNAEDLIKDFQQAYNQVRQAKITQEIAEIVGGAAAV